MVGRSRREAASAKPRELFGGKREFARVVEEHHQLAHAAAVALQEAVEEALHVRGARDVHRGRGRLNRFARGTRTVDARAHEAVEGVVFVRRHDEAQDRQSHALGEPSGVGVAEVAGGHGVDHFLAHAVDRLQVGPEVVDEVRDDAEPERAVDRADAVFAAEGLVGEHAVDEILTVVEGSFAHEVVNVRSGFVVKNPGLALRHAVLRTHENEIDPGNVREVVRGGRAHVARGGAEQNPGTLFFRHHALQVERREAQRQIVEGERRTVREFEKRHAVSQPRHGRHRLRVKGIAAE